MDDCNHSISKGQSCFKNDLSTFTLPRITGTAYENLNEDIVNVFGLDVSIKIETFQEANLTDNLLKNMKEYYNITIPTTIQKYALPIIMAGGDMVICAQSGFGKTLAFLIPLLNHLINESSNLNLDDNYCNPSALIISASRKKILHCFTTAVVLCKGTSVKCDLLYTGTSIKSQTKQLSLKKKGIHVVFANVPRLIYFLNKDLIKLSSLKFLVFDEADNIDLMPEIEHIVNNYTTVSSANRSTILLSKTSPEKSKIVQQLSYVCQKPDYKIVTVHNIWTHLDFGKQYSEIATITFIKVQKYQKKSVLLDFLQTFGDRDYQGTIVFVQRKRVCDFIATVLCEMDIPTISIHEDRTYSQCKMAIHNLKNKKFKVLVMTDVAFGELNSMFNFVINYDLPTSIEDCSRRIEYVSKFVKHHTIISFYDPKNDCSIGTNLANILIDGGQKVPEFLTSSLTEKKLWSDVEDDSLQKQL